MDPGILIDEREDIQKKTFTKWINSHLIKSQCSPVDDLFLDLRDGHRLLALLSVLTGKQLKPEKGRMRVHHINNINKVIQVIQEHGVKLVNISSDDIVGGNPKLILGLIWLIALEFNGQNLVKSQSPNGIEKSLLSWSRQFTEPHGLQLTNFSDCWSDGRAFLMILSANLKGVDLNGALKKHPLARLKTAFDLAYQHYKIEKLLDPEDVHTHKPDNKSIQMYVMCLYHAIEVRKQSGVENDGKNDNENDEVEMIEERCKEDLEPESENEYERGFVPGSSNVTDLDEVPLDNVEEAFTEVLLTSHNLTNDSIQTEKYDNPNIKAYIDYGFDDKSRPLSTATNASVELSSYQVALESVLSLLLEDEQILSRDLPEPEDFMNAKMQFHENENFMLKLTEHQQYVGEALEEGSNLINESQRLNGLTMEDQNEIRQQMVLLNERWETLRLKALDVQSRILMRLASFQTKQLDKLRHFLTNIEDRISHMSTLGPTLADVKDQLDEARGLKEDLHNQQNLVDSLSNMVVIVNDESGNFNDLEDKLAALGERWSHVVKWSEIRLEKLQQYKCITKWLDTREQDLKQMESRDVTDLGSIAKRMNDLNYCAKDLLELQRYLLDLRQMVAATLQEGDDKGEKVLEQLEGFEDRLEALKQIVEVQTERIETKGFKFGRDRASYDYSRVVKPKNWIDFQMMIRFGDDADDDEEADDDSSISHLDEEGSPGKKRKLRNNDNFYSLTNRIMDIFNFLDDCDERLQLLYRQSLRNQNEILSSLESEAMKRSESIENIKLLFEECEKDMPSRNLIMEATHIKQLEERLNNFSKRLIKQKSDLQDLLTKERFYNSLTGFKLVLADSRDWYKQHASSATKDELQQRLSDMESLSSEISNAKQNTISLSNDLQDWKDDFNIFYESWNDMKEAISTLIEEKSESTASSSKQINLRKLENFTFRSNNAQVIVSHLDAMHQQLKLFLNLQEELNSFQPTFSSLKDKQTDSISQEFFENWSNLPDLLNDRIIKQTTAIENLNHFNEEYETILAILLKLERNLKPFESSSNGDENSKSSFSPEQIGSRSSMELRKIEIDVISARNFSEIIIKEALPEHRSHLLDQINQLNELFARVQRLQQQHQQKRAQMLEKIEEILDRLNKTDIWLTSLESNTPKTEISEIKNSNELFQIKSKFQTLKETCEKETNNFRELNDFAGEVLDQIDELKVSGSQEIEAKYLLLRKKLTRLSARWTEVTALVYGKTALLEHISTQLGEFKKYMVSESGYLDRLETKIRATAENADAEEIIEELDDLENILRAHSDEWLEKIQEIGSELIEDEFMVDSIRKEIDTTTDRWLQLQQRAKQKTEILEKEVSEAEQSEKCLTQFEMWLSRVDEILSDHLENDVTIEDLPDDFQRLEHEFEMNEKNFRVIEDLIAEHTRNNKIEAANRLQEQLNLLELRFKSCQQKLNKCTAPQNAYESRLNRAVAELRSVEHSTLVLDVASAGPSSVHSQYQKCLQIYKTLSEIKPEIETTIKTGRKVCDDKYTRSPKQLSQRIDALKHLYNALGENVTQSKIFLETLLKLAQKLEDCFEIAESLIKRFESLEEMHERNSLFLEFEDVLQKCEEIYEEYLKSCDQIYLEETREKIDDLKATYLKLTSADVIKRLTEMKSTLQNLDNISLETLRAMEHDLKEINVPSNPEIKMLQQQVIAIVVYSLEHKFNQRSSITMDKDESPARMNDSKEEVEEDDTEIVIVSDTVRQRRSRTPQANDSFISNDSSQASPVKSSESSSSSKQKKSDDEKHILPDLLLPQTFRLAESSTLFSHISQNPEAAATKALENKTKDLDNKSRNKAQMVEIKETNIQNDKMSVQAVSFEPNQGEIVNTVSILESVEPFIPEYVETVQIVDLSEDSDSSLPVEAKRNGSTNTLNKSKSKSSPCNSPKVQHRTIDTEGAADSNVEMRQPLGNTSTPVLVIERQRISFEEKRKRIETERDILRDSEEENDGPIENKQPRVKRWRQLHLDITPEEDKENSIQKEQLKLDEYLESPLSPISRNSFYNTDSFDVEPLVFSDDEDIPRFSMEATPSFDSDSDTSRIETPSAKRPNTLLHKILSSSPSLDDSNITLKSPLSEIIPNIRNAGSLEQRVQEFEKTAKYMIRKLEATKEKIEQCDEGEKVVEDIKFLIAPDAATLISQGDSLVLETHGKQSSISRLVMKTQIVLREKFREVQQAKSKVPLAIHQQQTGAPSPRSTLEKASIKGINVEELVVKGLKRINDLIDKPVDHKSSEDLERRLEEINDRRDDLKLIVNAIGRNIEMPKVNSNMMSEIEKTKNNLVAHADNIELSLSELQEKSNIVNENGSDDYNDISSGSGPLAFSFDKSVLQIADWLTWEQNMIKIQSVSVDDVDAVMMAIEKQEKVLRELKMKKPQLNELVHTAEVLKGDVKRQQLQEKVTRLREHWDETSQCVLQRAAQLKNMLGDSQRYEFKRLELEKWLARMEARAERMGTIATTADILEAQQKEQKSFHAELHQNKPQFEVFNALTQKLIAVYPSDDTSRIKKLTEAVNQRYSNLNNGVINRGKQLHAAVHSLQSFDRAMDQFLAFLSESESLCENAESEIDRNPLMFKHVFIANDDNSHSDDGNDDSDNNHYHDDDDVDEAMLIR